MGNSTKDVFVQAQTLRCLNLLMKVLHKATYSSSVRLSQLGLVTTACSSLHLAVPCNNTKQKLHCPQDIHHHHMCTFGKFEPCLGLTAQSPMLLLETFHFYSFFLSACLSVLRCDACSRGMAGTLTPALLDEKTDENGTCFKDAAASAGYSGKSHQVRPTGVFLCFCLFS